MKYISAVFGLIFVLFVSLQASAVNEQTKDLITKNLVKLGLEADSISASSVDGLLEVITSRGLFYFSQDGRYMIHGKVYDVSEDIVNISERTLAAVRIKEIKLFENSMIVYPAKNEKHQVTVFTDTTCGYCRKLHSQMDAYNDLGITVRYLAFPRSGISGPTFKELKTIWCSQNPEKALTDVKNGGRVMQKQIANCHAPIAEQYAFGLKAGVSGTPAIIFENGTMVPGYQPPEALFAALEAAADKGIK